MIIYKYIYIYIDGIWDGMSRHSRFVDLIVSHTFNSFTGRFSIISYSSHVFFGAKLDGEDALRSHRNWLQGSSRYWMIYLQIW